MSSSDRAEHTCLACGKKFTRAGLSHHHRKTQNEACKNFVKGIILAAMETDDAPWSQSPSIVGRASPVQGFADDDPMRWEQDDDENQWQLGEDGNPWELDEEENIKWGIDADGIQWVGLDEDEMMQAELDPPRDEEVDEEMQPRVDPLFDEEIDGDWSSDEEEFQAAIGDVADVRAPSPTEDDVIPEDDVAGQPHEHVRRDNQLVARQPTPDQTQRPHVIVKFNRDRAGAPIRRTDNCGYNQYNTQLGGTNASIWAPFKSKIDWDIARWAKLRGPGSTALSELLKIESVSELDNEVPSFDLNCLNRSGKGLVYRMETQENSTKSLTRNFQAYPHSSTLSLPYKTKYLICITVIS
jgi:hypothetical protein